MSDDQFPLSFDRYLTPDALSVTASVPRRILIIGACPVMNFPHHIRALNPECEVDYMLFNNTSQLPDEPPRPIAEYDFQIVALPLRSIVHTAAYFQMPYSDIVAHEEYFEFCADTLVSAFNEAMKYNTKFGITTFVFNFMLPQANSMGRLLPKADLRNLRYFVGELNTTLDKLAYQRSNSYTYDFDGLVSTFGRKFYQGDSLWLSTIESLGDADYVLDSNRLQVPTYVHDIYPLLLWEIIIAWWGDILAMYRTTLQLDGVKLVIVDLDDTLWRGTVIEDGTFTTQTLDGWPLGILEALLTLKKRGIVLAIASKNSIEKVEAIWEPLVGGWMKLSDFGIKKINWRSKAENIAEIIAEANVLPNSVVFIDDNPVERAIVKESFPDIRVLGESLYEIRRTLLWSSETQVAQISTESSRRTEMIQAQVERDSVRKVLPREEFLAKLNVEISLRTINSNDDPEYNRAFELLNKTNQFNTTGKRWAAAEAQAYFAAGGVFEALHVTDRYTHYGLVGVICAKDDLIDQFVMSCRVIGLDVELSAVAVAVEKRKQAGFSDISSCVIETGANLLSRDIWERCAFTSVGGRYVSLAAPPMPAHVAIAGV